jgi:hypothetical protein
MTVFAYDAPVRRAGADAHLETASDGRIGASGLRLSLNIGRANERLLSKHDDGMVNCDNAAGQGMHG